MALLRMLLLGNGHRTIWVRLLVLSVLGFTAGVGCGTLLSLIQAGSGKSVHGGLAEAHAPSGSGHPTSSLSSPNGRPQLSPLPDAKDVWTCEVVVIGGSLGGVAAAAHAMQSGATTCLIELTPWLGGQVSAQGVSAIDESHTMLEYGTASKSWTAFKDLIAQQPISLPNLGKSLTGERVEDVNSCWVGRLCFPPKAGATASEQLLKSIQPNAPASRWGTSIAFKGAEFDKTGREITAVYAVRRVPRQPNYVPLGRLSKELASWYSWGGDATFDKVPMRLQAPAGKRLMVIDATDTGELIGWAGIPHRLGTESRATTGEVAASEKDNPDCTQAFTFPFVLAIHDDQGASLATLNQLESEYSQEEHRSNYDLMGYPMFSGRSFFNYRRIVSTTLNNPFEGTPVAGDMTIVNWNKGNDWNWMNPPLLLTEDQLDASGQRQNWLGGMSVVALKHAENHALLFAEWLIEHQSKPEFPLTYLAGAETPLGTESGLSMVPYIREGRRIIGRRAYGQRQFMIREADIRRDLEGRDFNANTIGVIHYDIDIHGCRYRNWEPSGEASNAPTQEVNVRPTQIPIESIIPEGVDNLLIGGKGLAVTHIANAITRIHYSEWTVGAAAGATAGWLVEQAQPLTPVEIVPRRLMPKLQDHLVSQGLRLDW